MFEQDVLVLTGFVATRAQVDGNFVDLLLLYEHPLPTRNRFGSTSSTCFVSHPGGAAPS